MNKPLNPNQVLKTVDVSEYVNIINAELQKQEWYRHDFGGGKGIKVEMRINRAKRFALEKLYEREGWTKVDIEDTLRDNVYRVVFKLANWSTPPKEE